MAVSQEVLRQYSQLLGADRRYAAADQINIYYERMLRYQTEEYTKRWKRWDFVTVDPDLELDIGL